MIMFEKIFNENPRSTFDLSDDFRWPSEWGRIIPRVRSVVVPGFVKRETRSRKKSNL